MPPAPSPPNFRDPNFGDPTFRDPAGSLLLTGSHAVRTIHPAARSAVLRFLDSPLRHRLEERGDMVATVLAAGDDPSVAEEAPSAPLQLHHPLVSVITYPWEWTPHQWLAAAELTLSLCEEALGQDAGQQRWILKDATPLNILFIGPRPVLVDVLSFEPHVPGNSIWLAYGQYLRTFLLPLLMARLLRWPLALALFKRDGFEPAEMYAALSWPQRLSPSALFPITLPALLTRRKPEAAPVTATAKDPGLALHLLRGTLRGLRRRTRKALPEQATSEWSDYKSSLTHYTSTESAEKLAFVREVLLELQPRRVLDIGANTGEFSALAASLGASVVALERDAAAADRLYRRTLAQGSDILTIHADLARPTPAAGWRNTESYALLARLARPEAKADLVLMLAVIHHLLLMEQVPLAAILDLLTTLTRRSMVLEWVPATDPMFQSLLRGRDELYGHLTEAELLRACEGRFRILRRHPLANGRVLFLMELFSVETSEAGTAA